MIACYNISSSPLVQHPWVAEEASMEEVNGRMFASINVMFSKDCLSSFITTNCCKLVQQLSQDLPLLVVQLVAKEWSTVPTVLLDWNLFILFVVWHLLVPLMQHVHRVHSLLLWSSM